jgi:hypothetical protein
MERSGHGEHNGGDGDARERLRRRRRGEEANGEREDAAGLL